MHDPGARSKNGIPVKGGADVPVINATIPIRTASVAPFCVNPADLLPTGAVVQSPAKPPFKLFQFTPSLAVKLVPAPLQVLSSTMLAANNKSEAPVVTTVPLVETPATEVTIVFDGVPSILNVPE